MNLTKRVCVICNNYFYAINRNKIYCGSQLKKEGCAYKMQLVKIAQWNEKHPSLVRGFWNRAVKKYRNNHPGQALKISKAYYIENKDIINKKKRIFYLKNKEKLNKRCSEYYKLNKNKWIKKTTKRT